MTESANPAAGFIARTSPEHVCEAPSLMMALHERDRLIAGLRADVCDAEERGLRLGLEQAAAHVEKLRALEESVPAIDPTTAAIRGTVITEFEVLRDHFAEQAKAAGERDTASTPTARLEALVRASSPHASWQSWQAALDSALDAVYPRNIACPHWMPGTITMRRGCHACEATCAEHQPIQHRDGKPPWCRACGLTAEFQKPVSTLGKKCGATYALSRSREPWECTLPKGHGGPHDVYGDRP